MEAPPSTPLPVEWGLVVPNVPGLQPFLKLVGTGSLGVHKLLPQGTKGTVDNLEGSGGQDPTDEFGQSTDVGESHRSTGHLVPWSPPNRLWQVCLCIKPFG